MSTFAPLSSIISSAVLLKNLWADDLSIVTHFVPDLSMISKRK
uniref:Uncharacterized protein n=1 Tax=Strongyloides papillosus TaxID=174720 RepID=A0A0N5BBT5_STREA